MEKVEMKINTILEHIKEYFEMKKDYTGFVPGKTKLHYSGANIDQEEMVNAVSTLLTNWGGWLAEGKNTIKFEKEFAKYMGGLNGITTTSGTLALISAFATLKDKSLANPLKDGDEVITQALTFPSTLNCIIHNNLKPVLVDVDMERGTMDPKLIEKMITEKTKAILILHHFGVPADMDAIMAIAKKHNLYVIEDCCDGHDATYKGQKVGTFGDMACFSFYCAHQMTMGEGGYVLSNKPEYIKILRSLKRIGMDCFCGAGEIKENGVCNKRFEYELAGEPFDHRFVYSRVGYKMTILDFQAAMGLVQLKKLKGFVDRREEIHDKIMNYLEKYSNYLHVTSNPEDARTSWFATPILVKDNKYFTRKELTEFLEKKLIETRPLLGGNLLLHPAYSQYNFDQTDMDNTNAYHKAGFYIGCNPIWSDEAVEYIFKSFDEFFAEVIK